MRILKYYTEADAISCIASPISSVFRPCAPFFEWIFVGILIETARSLALPIGLFKHEVKLLFMRINTLMNCFHFESRAAEGVERRLEISQIIAD